MKIGLSLVALVALAVAAGCPQTPTSEPSAGDAGCGDQAKKCPPCNCAADASLPVDAPDAAPPAADQAALACLNLQKIGCSDGYATDCAAVLRAVESSGKFRISVTGLLSANTIAQARSAGASCGDAGK